MPIARFFRSLIPALGLVGLLATSDASLAMSVETRSRLDLSAYSVKDPDAGYFDVAARRKALLASGDKIVVREIAKLRKMDSCTRGKAMPVISGADVIPRFYGDRAAWREGAQPYLDFQDVVTQLAAQQVIAPDIAAGQCLLDLLDAWAAGNGFMDVSVDVSGLQTWFQSEASLAAAGFAYAVVRSDIVGHDEQKKRIEAWLVAAARNHLSYEGGKDGSCCNNHFYRRAVYASIIGVVAKDDDLFRIGISALYSAIADAGPKGELALEMRRQEFAARYQIYATMQLAMIAQIAARQGYPLSGITYEGRDVSDVIHFAVSAMLSPDSVAELARTASQDKSFVKDRQYYAWLELLIGQKQWQDSAQSLVAEKRPTYNRSLGGYLTLFFMPLGQTK